MTEPEDDPALVEAERHVREGQERIARHLVLVNALDRAGRYDEARAARVLLAALTDTLDVARRHLYIQQKAQRWRRAADS